jgi:hypothetical protein
MFPTFKKYTITSNPNDIMTTSNSIDMKLFLVSSINEPCGLTYINPYKLCEICGKQEKNPSSFFPLPNECQCPSPKTDLEILQDEVNSLKKKVNKLIKQQNK